MAKGWMYFVVCSYWRATHFWLITAVSAGVRVLCDPWLTGDLVFGGQTWLYRGKKTAVRDLDVPAIGHSADLLVLSQVRLHCTAFMSFAPVYCIWQGHQSSVLAGNPPSTTLEGPPAPPQLYQF